MNFCVNCGTKLQNNFRFCASCGSPISAASNPVSEENKSLLSDQSKTSFIIENSSDTIRSKDYVRVGQSSNDYIGQFVGDKYSYYAKKWQAIIPEEGKIISLNWPALLLGTIWFAYRKMYYAWFLTIGTILLFSILELIFGYSYMFLTMQLSLGVTLGMMGNYLYMLHVKKNVKDISSLNNSDIIRLELNKRGGTSLAHAFGLVIIAFVFNLLIRFVLDLA